MAKKRYAPEAGVVAGAVTHRIRRIAILVDAAIRVVEAQTADRHTRANAHIGTQHQLFGERIAATKLQLVATVVRQVAVGEVHQLCHVPILGLGDVVLAELRLNLTFGITL